MSSEQELEKLSDFWKKYFGVRQAEKIIESLKPFFGWEPKLQPAPDDLIERVIKAIFWQEKLSDVVALSWQVLKCQFSQFWSSRRVIFWESLVEKFQEELEQGLKKEQQKDLRLALQTSLPFTCSAEIGGGTVDDKLWEAIEAIAHILASQELKSALRAEMRSNLWYSLFYAAGFCLVGAEREKFRPLLELWLAGNFPAWFDRHQRLIILCAPLEVQSYNHCGSVSGLLTGQAANP